MIICIDPVSKNVQHEQFNISFIKLIQTAFPLEEIEFVGNSSHIENLKSRIFSNEIRFRIFERLFNGKINNVNKIIQSIVEYRLLCGELEKALSNKDVNAVFILLINPLTHLLLKRNKNIKKSAIIILHGELESLKFNKTLLNKVWGYFLLKALKSKNKLYKHLILGQSIFENLVKIVPELKRYRQIVIDHPYPFSYKESIKYNSGGGLLFSICGVATIHKNSHFFFEVAKEVAAISKNKNIDFQVCGQVYADMNPFLNNSVQYKPVGQLLSREELIKMNRESDFFVFYYNNDNYSMCSSGAFWDAIDAEKPLLYLHNDYLDYYCNMVGPIGYVFSDIELLNKFIMSFSFSEVNVNEYDYFVSNIRTLKNRNMTTLNLSKKLKEQL